MIAAARGSAKRLESMKPLPLIAPSCIAFALLALSHSAKAAEPDYARFVGEFAGEATYVSEGTEYKRDLGVSIKLTDEGFNVSWTTTTYKPSGKEKTSKYSIDFLPSKRENIYASAMKRNIFGGREALDPMKGDPYVWARITGDTLSVFALIILDNGGYDMQVYRRTLSETGMELDFTRLRNGENVRQIRSTLQRTDA